MSKAMEEPTSTFLYRRDVSAKMAYEGQLPIRRERQHNGLPLLKAFLAGRGPQQNLADDSVDYQRVDVDLYDTHGRRYPAALVGCSHKGKEKLVWKLVRLRKWMADNNIHSGSIVEFHRDTNNRVMFEVVGFNTAASANTARPSAGNFKGADVPPLGVLAAASAAPLVEDINITRMMIGAVHLSIPAMCQLALRGLAPHLRPDTKYDIQLRDESRNGMLYECQLWPDGEEEPWQPGGPVRWRLVGVGPLIRLHNLKVDDKVALTLCNGERLLSFRVTGRGPEGSGSEARGAAAAAGGRGGGGRGGAAAGRHGAEAPAGSDDEGDGNSRDGSDDEQDGSGGEEGSSDEGATTEEEGDDDDSGGKRGSSGDEAEEGDLEEGDGRGGGASGSGRQSHYAAAAGASPKRRREEQRGGFRGRTRPAVATVDRNPGSKRRRRAEGGGKAAPRPAKGSFDPLYGKILAKSEVTTIVVTKAMYGSDGVFAALSERVLTAQPPVQLELTLRAEGEGSSWKATLSARLKKGNHSCKAVLLTRIGPLLQHLGLETDDVILFAPEPDDDLTFRVTGWRVDVASAGRLAQLAPAELPEGGRRCPGGGAIKRGSTRVRGADSGGDGKAGRDEDVPLAVRLSWTKSGDIGGGGSNGGAQPLLDGGSAAALDRTAAAPAAAAGPPPAPSPLVLRPPSGAAAVAAVDPLPVRVLPASSITHAHGCPPCGPPPVQPGELRICGYTFHPQLREGVLRAMDVWMESLRAQLAGNPQAAANPLARIHPAKQQMAVLGIDPPFDLPAEATTSGASGAAAAPQGLVAAAAATFRKHRLSSNVICNRLASMLGLKGEHGNCAAPLPEACPPWVEGLVPCNNSERGGGGLLATKDIAVNVPLGVMAGYVLPAAERNELLSFRACDPRVRAELSKRAGDADVTVAWDFLVDAFSMPHVWGPAAGGPPQSQLQAGTGAAAAPKPGYGHWKTWAAAAGRLPEASLCMLGYGCLGAFVNDPRAEPRVWVDGNDVDCALGSTAQPNCLVLPIAVRGLVLAVLVSLRPIKPGEQLIRDYGAEWWHQLRDAWELLEAEGLTAEQVVGAPVPDATAGAAATAAEPPLALAGTAPGFAPSAMSTDETAPAPSTVSPLPLPAPAPSPHGGSAAPAVAAATEGDGATGLAVLGDSFDGGHDHAPAALGRSQQAASAAAAPSGSRSHGASEGGGIPRARSGRDEAHDGACGRGRDRERERDPDELRRRRRSRSLSAGRYPGKDQGRRRDDGGLYSPRERRRERENREEEGPRVRPPMSRRDTRDPAMRPQEADPYQDREWERDRGWESRGDWHRDRRRGFEQPPEYALRRGEEPQREHGWERRPGQERGRGGPLDDEDWGRGPPPGPRSWGPGPARERSPEPAWGPLRNRPPGPERSPGCLPEWRGQPTSYGGRGGGGECRTMHPGPRRTAGAVPPPQAPWLQQQQQYEYGPPLVRFLHGRGAAAGDSGGYGVGGSAAQRPACVRSRPHGSPPAADESDSLRAEWRVRRMGGDHSATDVAAPPEDARGPAFPDPAAVAGGGGGDRHDGCGEGTTNGREPAFVHVMTSPLDSAGNTAPPAACEVDQRGDYCQPQPVGTCGSADPWVGDRGPVKQEAQEQSGLVKGPVKQVAKEQSALVKVESDVGGDQMGPTQGLGAAWDPVSGPHDPQGRSPRRTSARGWEDGGGAAAAGATWQPEPAPRLVRGPEMKWQALVPYTEAHDERMGSPA